MALKAHYLPIEPALNVIITCRTSALTRNPFETTSFFFISVCSALSQLRVIPASLLLLIASERWLSQKGHGWYNPWQRAWVLHGALVMHGESFPAHCWRDFLKMGQIKI